MSTIYKILTPIEHEEFITSGVFKGSEVDLRDGYIHSCDSMDQVDEILERFFKGQKNLTLIHFDVEGLDLRYEVDPGSGNTYPHVYEAIPANRVITKHSLQA